jgi:flagellar M-ring protein FliF
VAKFGLVAVSGFLEAFSRFGMQRLAAMVAVTIALVAFFGFVIMRVTTPAMTTLFSEMSIQDSNQIVRELESRGIEYQMRQEGQIVMVPQDQALRLRMDFASRGMPAGGGVGYEVFDKSDNFSSTSFVQQMNKLRALEGELSRTIRTLDRVSQARVHLVVPERRLFERDKVEPRASIVLKINGDLDQSGVRAIRHLVASAVEGLKPEKISIVDEGGRLLADGAADGTDAAAMQGEKQSAIERRMKGQIEEIVASVVGSGRARVQVAADMDFNRVQQTSETFDPESRVIRSTQSRNENSQSQEAQNEVTVGNQLPAANQQNPPQAGPKDAAEKADEVVNYEISKTVRTETVEGGRIKRLSVAVLVDGNYTKAADGTMAYAPRAQEEIDRITSLVRTAVGFDQARGDQVEIVNLKFADAPEVIESPEPTMFERLFGFTKDDTIRFVELGVFAGLTLMVLFLVVRPMMRQIIAPEKMAAIKNAILPGSGDNPQLAGPGGTLALPGPDGESQLVQISNVNGGVNSMTLQKVGEVVKDNPQETVAVLRNWLHG